MLKKVYATREAKRFLNKLKVNRRSQIDPIKFAQDRKVEVIEKDFEGLDISAILIKKGGKGVIAVNKDHSDTRKRFSVAHELGHLILHTDDEFLTIEKGAEPPVYLRSEYHDLDEMAANQFAAEILMPEDMIRHDLQDLLNEGEENYISKLAKLYKVSETAITFRLKNLKLL